MTQLLNLGYDDASRTDLPLITTYAKGSSVTASSPAAAVGTRIGRDLPSFGATRCATMTPLPPYPASSQVLATFAEVAGAIERGPPG
ncbi:hypothetical protein GR925_36500 [Streptomyces sp. HUCO-GS316]|nr:hypothetical protein [Streptomyces sp. HUCO-GS316]